MIRRMLPALAGVAFMLGLPTGAPAADDPPLDLTGKTIRFLLPNAPGSGTDLQGRMIARYLAKHLPGNPTIVPQNVAGGSGMKLISYLKSLDGKEDLIIATINSGLPFKARAGTVPEEVFDPRKVKWVGTLVDSTNICVVGTAADTGDLESLRKKELAFGTQAKTSPPHAVYMMLNRGAGFRIRPVIGYDSAGTALLAVARGEIDGECISKSSSSIVKPMVDDGKMRVFLYFGPNRRDDMDVPYVFDVDLPPDRQEFLKLAIAATSFGRPIAVHEDSDPRFLAAVRKALQAVASDPDYLKEAATVDIDVRYTSAEEIERAVGDLYATPDATIAEIAELVSSD